MNVGDLVGDAPFVCGPDTTVAAAARAMEESDLGSLAVVEGTALLGLITERDIRRAVAQGADLDVTQVSGVMSDDPDTFDPDLDVWDAASWMACPTTAICPLSMTAVPCEALYRSGTSSRH